MKKPLLAAVLFSFVALPARGETFHMKDGSRFEGTVIGVGAEDLQVSISGKTVAIRKDSISSIEYEPDAESSLSRAGEWQLRVGAGGALPQSVNAFNNIARPGLATNIEFLLNVTPRWAMGLRTDDFVFTTAYPSNEVSRGKAVVQGGALYFEGRWLARPEKRFSPFALAGLGFNTFSEELEARPKPGFQWADTGTVETREFENTGSGIAFMAGAGLQYLFGRRGVASVEAAWHDWGIDKNTFGSAYQASNFVQTVSLDASIGARF